MRILALNPYAAGSHKAFFDAWHDHSRHDWTILELPGWNWKWRMRTGAIDLAARVSELVGAGHAWDLVLCTDMMNAAEWRGLAPPAVGRLPLVIYFHENQAAYPASAERGTDPRDVHFILTNMVSALAADEAWFNSAYNLRTFTEGLASTLAPIPQGPGSGLIERVASRARVEPPGVDDALFAIGRATRAPGPLRILWAARWEFDKRPAVFAEALELLAAGGIDFVVDLLGGPSEIEERKSNGASPASEGEGVMRAFRARLGSRVRRFGQAASREDFVSALAEADVIVSTAAHEFFGLAVVEAVAAGAIAAVPRDLAYPEVLGEGWPLFHDGTPEDVCGKLETMARRVADTGTPWPGDPSVGRARVERYRWSARGAAMDAALERVAASHRP